MAKLSAHGSEFARLHRYVPSTEDPDFAGEDVYFSLRTDGYVLCSFQLPRFESSSLQ